MIYFNLINKKKLFIQDKTFIISDFDRTITTGKSATTWSIFTDNELVDPRLGIDAQKLFDYYRAIEINNNISLKDKSKHMETWARKEISLFSKYGITENKLYDIIDESNTIVLRPDFKKFVKKMEELNVKIYIVSGGMYDVIKYTLEKNNIMSSNIEIISNHLDFNNGKIKGFKGDIIHSCNKDIIPLPITSSETGLLFGDLPGDKAVGYNYNTVDVAFLNEQDEYGCLTLEEKEKLIHYNKIFDLVLTENSSFDTIGKKLIKNYK